MGVMALSLYDAQDVMRKESDNIYNIKIYIWSPFCRNFPDFCHSNAFRKKLSNFLNDGSRSDFDH